MNADPLSEFNRDLSPAEVVRSVFKPREITREIGVSRSTMWRWSQPAPKGAGGRVPSGYHVDLMRLAQQLGRQLTAEDLVLGRNRQEG